MTVKLEVSKEAKEVHNLDFEVGVLRMDYPQNPYLKIFYLSLLPTISINRQLPAVNSFPSFQTFPTSAYFCTLNQQH